MFKKQYSNALEGPKEWQGIDTSTGDLFKWDSSSTYVQQPPFFTGQSDDKEIIPIENARPLLLLGNSVTTDHISPAGAIKAESPAGSYFMERQIRQNDFNSYGARRGNHEVMVRGTFANIRIKNQLLSNVEGGYSILEPEKRKAVIAESFERIHRSNLVGMGVLPIQLNNHKLDDLDIKSSDLVDIRLDNEIKPLQDLEVSIKSDEGVKVLECTLRIDTINELQYYKADGILNFVLKNILKN